MGAGCTKEGSATTARCPQGRDRVQDDGMIEEVVKLHMELVALTFACNYNRVATLQWGDGTDATKYNVPADASLGWRFHHISHRVTSDGSAGSNPTAEQAHTEIDALRMQTLLYGLNQFRPGGSRTRRSSCGRTTSPRGRAIGGERPPHHLGERRRVSQAGRVHDAGNVGNNRLFNTLITAAVRDKGRAVNFGAGPRATSRQIKA